MGVANRYIGWSISRVENFLFWAAITKIDQLHNVLHSLIEEIGEGFEGGQEGKKLKNGKHNVRVTRDVSKGFRMAEITSELVDEICE